MLRCSICMGKHNRTLIDINHQYQITMNQHKNWTKKLNINISKGTFLLYQLPIFLNILSYIFLDKVIAKKKFLSVGGSWLFFISPGWWIGNEQLFKVGLTPVFKKDNQDCNNYRPILLLPNISKIFEKLIHDRFLKFLEKNKCLFSKQFVFKNKHSTTHALIDLTETIRKVLDDDEFACGVFLDFKKAFDLIYHKILLKKLEHDRVRRHAVKWFSSYLTEKK